MELKLQDLPFQRIKEKIKTIEMRLNDERRENIHPGEILTLLNQITGETLNAEVVKVEHFSNFIELYKRYDKKELGYLENETADADDMLKFYKVEQINKYGVLAIKIALIEEKREYMKEVSNQTLTGERAAYSSIDTEFINCTFKDGESPLKESRHISVKNCAFKWKYPLWYIDDVVVKNTTWYKESRSGVWYTKNITIIDSDINAPKQFRRCENLTIRHSNIPDAQETLWACNNVIIDNMYAKGDYFGMNCKNVKVYNLHIDGNYCFDGAENLEIHNSIFNSKDSFWNCKNVVIYNSVIKGEYLAWNSENITFINCELESNQGLCYIKGVKLINCKVNNTDLCFERCSDVDAEIITQVISIKNPYNGVIRCKGYDELILDEKVIDPSKVKIEII